MNKLRRKINEMAGSERGQLLGYLFGVFIGILLLPITLPLVLILAIFLHLWLRKQMKDYGLDKQFKEQRIPFRTEEHSLEPNGWEIQK